MNKTLIVLVVILAVTVGCGGGGSSSSTTVTATPSTPQSTVGLAQGVYAGTSSNGWSFSSILLPNDKYYAIYGTQSSSVFLIYGMMTGQGTSSTNAYTASVSDFYYTGTVLTGNLNANYVAGSSMNGSIVESGTTLSFNGTVMPTSDFNYNVPATVSAITGTWNGSFFDGTSGTVTIASGGNFSGTNAGCSFTGTVTPDTAKNFFNLTVTFGTGSCLLPNQTVSGIAISYQITGTTKRQLLMGGATSTKATVFVAIR